MNSEKFKEIVNVEVVLQGRPIETRECPDQYLGLICESVSMHQFARRLPANQRPSHACIVMVLESPHVDEYVGELGPAKGATGEMIRQHLMISLGLAETQNFGLILVNAIQHQCSLGSNTAVYRDRIFRAVWANGGEKDFSSRISTLYRSGDVLVNCCTRGNDFEINMPLRNLVEVALRKSIPDAICLRRTHPASWFDAKWRGKEWKV